MKGYSAITIFENGIQTSGFEHFSFIFPNESKRPRNSENPRDQARGFEKSANLRLYEDFSDDPLNDGVREEDDEETETNVDEDGLSFLHLFFITTGRKDEEAAVESVENRENSKEKHEVPYETLNRGVGRSVGTLDSRLDLIGTEINGGGSRLCGCDSQSDGRVGGFLHDVHGVWI